MQQRRAVLIAGGAGVLALLWIAAAREGYVDTALILAFIVGVVTATILFLARRQEQAASPPPAAVVLRPAPPPAPHPGYEATLEALPDPVMVLKVVEPDAAQPRRIVFANAAAREFLRIPREGALLVSALRDPEVLSIAEDALGGVEGSVAFETRGAQDRFWRAWARPLPPLEPGARMALLALRDETDSRRMAQMRADFLANASHELRTPLASLAGFIETLKGPARDDVAARDKFLGIMGAQAERMGRLIADLLSLSRIELNEHVPPAGRADLSLVVGDVIDALSPIARHKGVTLEALTPAAGDARVTGDRDQLVQVVQNLVDNALKYSPEGGTVTVEVRSGVQGMAPAFPLPEGAARLSLLTPDHGDDGRWAMLRVTDRGPGIARQHLPRLSERFYRVEGQKSGERLGTGLGLAIVKHILNRHRGGLSVESAPGEGASFSAYFPMCDEDAVQAAVREAS